MMAIPKIISKIRQEFPNLLILFENKNDLFTTEQWGAVLSDKSDNAIYRYVLWRVFDENLPLLVVFMLNPSKATHLKTDRTIDGLIKRARRLGYGGIIVINCFAYRSTQPSEMKKASDPVGPDNDKIISIVLSHEIDLLCAWGTNATFKDREKDVKCVISSTKAKPFILRLCAGGTPEHPLYIPQKIGLTPWPVNCQDS